MTRAIALGNATNVRSQVRKKRKEGKKMKMNYERIKRHNKEHGVEQAYNLLLLGGPDHYEGDDYFEVLEDLEKRMKTDEILKGIDYTMGLLPTELTLATKLYDYLDVNPESVLEDYEYGYLSINEGRDTEQYLWYDDGVKSGCISIANGEITIDKDDIEKLFS